MWGLLVQVALVGGLVACVTIAGVIFARLLRQPKGQRVVLQFLGINAFIYVVMVIVVQVLIHPQALTGLLLGAFFFTLFANIPLAILGKIIEVFWKRKQ